MQLDAATAVVSLTFDGGLTEHVELVGPMLRERGWKATFFVEPTAFLLNVNGWKKLAEEGHEIGSHSLFSSTDHGRLLNWTLEMVRDDLEMTQRLVQNTLGKAPVSFALPGPDWTCAEGVYLPVVKEMFSVVCDNGSVFSSGHAPLESGILRRRLVSDPGAVTLPYGAWNVVLLPGTSADFLSEFFESIGSMPGLTIAPVCKAALSLA